SFVLTTSVSDGTETFNAATNSRSVCDAAGNCSPAGPIDGIKVDKQAPSVSCASPDGLWHASDVGIACTASDASISIADADFTLTTNVPSGTETVTASTSDHTVCDAVGHCTTAGPVIGIQVDKKAPA